MRTCLLLGAVVFSTHALAAGGSDALLPAPRSLEPLAGRLLLRDGDGVAACAEGASAARLLREGLRERCSLRLRPGGERVVVRLGLRHGLEPEGYRLAVEPDGIRIEAGAPEGFVWGVQTLLQWLGSESRPIGGGALGIDAACVRIEDSPRFPWRGLMLDCSRTFQSLDYLRATIERMSSWKLNTLHLHLTDDQGWRLEILSHPELTRDGARFGSHYGEPARHEGFYTRAEMAELIAFARERGVTIVPEIEFPGHCLALLSVHPELSCSGGPFEVFPYFQGPGVLDDVLCVGNDDALALVDDVIGEVASLFPSEFLHVGGDEVPKTKWLACPKCRARMAREGLASGEELQSWFFHQVESMVDARGKRLIGWDEILEGGLAPRAAVMSWRGTGGGIAAARAGHDVVMAPTSHCYFDYSYGAIDSRTAWEFEPIPPELGEEQSAHILGLQACFWSHIDREPERVDYQLYPRLLSLAERAWVGEQAESWERFDRRRRAQFAELDRLGVHWNRTDGLMTAIGRWDPSTCPASWGTLEWDVTEALAHGGTWTVTFRYASGALRLGIQRVALLEDGREVAADEHYGTAGGSHNANDYRLELPAWREGARYALRAEVQAEYGSSDSAGSVYLTPEE